MDGRLIYLQTDTLGKIVSFFGFGEEKEFPAVEDGEKPALENLDIVTLADLLKASGALGEDGCVVVIWGLSPGLVD